MKIDHFTFVVVAAFSLIISVILPMGGPAERQLLMAIV